MLQRLSLERLLGWILLLLLWIPASFVGDAIHLGIHFTLILSISWQLGELLFSEEPSPFLRSLVGLGIWIPLAAILFTGAYYLSIPLTGTVHQIIESAIALVITGVYTFFSSKTDAPALASFEESRLVFWLRRFSIFCLTMGALLGAGLVIRLFFLHGTYTSIQTPWTLLPKGLFLTIAIPFFAAMMSAWKERSSVWLSVSTFASWACVAFLTPLLYPLGYGFDGFIHRASEHVLQTSGTLVPKPFYYIGQYVWTTWIAQTFDLSLHAVDVWLLPIAILLPLFALFLWTRKREASHRWVMILTIFFLPLGAFITTTPQSFSYLLALGVIIAALWAHQETHRGAWALPVLWALWATAAHPLGGLPALCFVGGAWLSSFFSPSSWKARGIITLGSIGALISIPAAFWIQSQLGTLSIAWSWATLLHLSWTDIFSPLLLQPRQTLTFWVDATEWTHLAIHILLFGVGIWQMIRPVKPLFRSIAFIGVGLLVVQWLLEHVATFGFLISYERSNYTERLNVLSTLFLAPIVASWISTRLDALQKRSMILFSGVLVLFIAAWPLRVYNAFPRQDAAASSSGWNVSSADLEAVHWIHEQASTKKYAVLANQSVSAAALETYGFARYTGDVFYYPIPTSGPLYQRYLRVASTEGTLADIKEAQRLTDSDDLFVVIDAYWWNADLINERLAKTADQAISFDHGTVWVYRFR